MIKSNIFYHILLLFLNPLINVIFVYGYTWCFITECFELLKDNEITSQRKLHLHLFLCCVFSVQFNIFLFTCNHVLLHFIIWFNWEWMAIHKIKVLKGKSKKLCLWPGNCFDIINIMTQTVQRGHNTILHVTVNASLP